MIPKFKLGDTVIIKFTYKNILYDIKGTVEIIDENGTLEQSEQVSYDIMVKAINNPIENYDCLYKHITEKDVVPYSFDKEIFIRE